MKQTFSIGRKSGASLLHSVRTAQQVWGRPLNYVVVINFWQLDEDADTIFRAFADLREKWFAAWSRTKPRLGRYAGQKRNGTPTYAYVHEATKDLPHTHWMVHVQPGNELEFQCKLTNWLKKRYDLKELPPGALHISKVWNPEGLKLYLAKGLDPHFAAMWRIRSEDTGRIAFRRADVSRNLGPQYWRENKARYRSGRRAA